MMWQNLGLPDVILQLGEYVCPWTHCTYVLFGRQISRKAINKALYVCVLIQNIIGWVTCDQLLI